ncbi:hypothetical protein P7C70_g8769, partial [Phenoliferia sp. Uapishka_3]
MTSRTNVYTSGLGSTGCNAMTNDPSPLLTHHQKIGAIVGGVVGGVALLSLIAVVCWVCGRRRSKAKADKAETASASTGSSFSTFLIPKLNLETSNEFFGPEGTWVKNEQDRYRDSTLPPSPTLSPTSYNYVNHLYTGLPEASPLPLPGGVDHQPNSPTESNGASPVYVTHGALPLDHPTMFSPR